ncbi:MAG: hypothetical protein WA865_15445 [Spirulinaceae cyanobacterium]
MKILIVILIIALSSTTALAAGRQNKQNLSKNVDFANLSNTNLAQLDNSSEVVNEPGSRPENLEEKTSTAYGEPSRGSNSTKGGSSR